MNDFDGLLASDYGFKPQGKAAPMAASKGSVNLTSRSSNPLGAIDDYDSIFGASANNDSMFGGSTNHMGANKSSSLPVYDKPVYGDDILYGVPGLKSSSAVNYDDVFSSVVSPSKSSTFDDLLGSLSGTRSESNSGRVKESEKAENGVDSFDDLLSGFCGSSPRINRHTSETRRPSKSTINATNIGSNMMEDPFVGMGSASPSKVSPPGTHSQTASFEESGKFNMYRNSKFDSRGPLGTLEKSMPVFSLVGRSSVTSPANQSDENSQEDVALPTFEENHEPSNDVWLTVSEVPLFTPVTKAPPPLRPPPPRPSKDASKSSRRTVNEFSSVPNSSRYFGSSNTATVSQLDQLEDFAMGRSRSDSNKPVDVEINSDAAASAAAMKEAMDRAEAKFRHAKEVKEKENAKAARYRESIQVGKDEREIGQNERQRREREERERNREKIEREKEEKEREERKLEKEKERVREIEREREKARQAVERATREARERAAMEARLKAEKSAFDKVNAEARQRAERAAVQRAQSEARERAAAQAKDRAEKTAAEAKENASRAEADARSKAQRVAVERAAAEARDRASAAAKVHQHKNNDDLESFFGVGVRPSSAPKTRDNFSDPLFDTSSQTRTRPEMTRRTSVGTSSSMKKASSTTNIADDLSSIFGATPSSGNFQEMDGESEDRRRARLERHQRTQERAAKALAEKNQRDLQIQKDQAERNRIGETLDAQIKRWAAGKEGNLRALLSTLQYVLWPECGWQPVSLTDLIMGAAVKKVYRKATLCIHPDKVQQKGATLQQKYVAEKVFDLLKDAWNKFNSEELF